MLKREVVRVEGLRVRVEEVRVEGKRMRVEEGEGLKENKFAFRDCECQLKDRLFELKENRFRLKDWRFELKVRVGGSPGTWIALERRA